jgi:hypothetical protein
MTIREALDEKRVELKGKVKSLFVCKRELFYVKMDGTTGNGVDDSVYPVSNEIVASEAEFFGVEWQEV